MAGRNPTAYSNSLKPYFKAVSKYSLATQVYPWLEEIIEVAINLKYGTNTRPLLPTKVFSILSGLDSITSEGIVGLNSLDIKERQARNYAMCCRIIIKAFEAESRNNLHKFTIQTIDNNEYLRDEWNKILDFMEDLKWLEANPIKGLRITAT